MVADARPPVSFKVPEVIFVSPVYVLAPDSVRLPSPDLINVRADVLLLITPAIDAAPPLVTESWPEVEIFPAVMVPPELILMLLLPDKFSANVMLAVNGLTT